MEQYNNEIIDNDMETTLRTQNNVYDNLVNLRNKVKTLATQTEDEALLADIVAMLSGM